MAYYDLEALLAEEERMQCTFSIQAFDCGCFDPSTREKDLQIGHELELPLWLATPLAQRGDITVKLPNYLAKRYRNHIRAGPAAVNLREHTPFFYEIGWKLVQLVDEDDARGVEEVLRIALGGERYRQILNESMNCRDQDTTEFTRKLTQLEKGLFEAGLRGAEDFYNWKSKQNATIQCAAVLENSRKRRRFTDTL